MPILYLPVYTMELPLKVAIGTVHLPLSGQGFAPMAFDLCVAMVSGSAPYHFKQPSRVFRRSVEKLED